MVMQKKMDEINTKTSNQDLIHQSKPKPTSTDHFLQPQVRAQAQARRPRGFAATAETMGSRNNKKVTEVTGTTPKTTVISNKGKREREKEKERAKLRERHRRAITTRMLAGLRQYGDFSLPARADMNDVLAALAREAGWIVETDGTTFRHSPPPHNMVTFSVRLVDSPILTSSLRDCQQTVLRSAESLSPVSLDSAIISERDTNVKYTSTSPINSIE